MTDDPTGDRPAALEALDHLDVGTAPIGAIVAASDRRKRRRRAVFASVAAVAVLIAGVSVATAGTSNITGPDRSIDAADTTQTPAPELSVTVEPVPENTDAKVWPASATWDPEQRTLSFGLAGSYGSCPPEGSASAVGSVTTLVITVPNADRPCAAFNTSLAVISGLQEAPTELQVTENGKTVTVSVVDVSDPGAERPFDALDMTLVLGEPDANGALSARLRVENNTGQGITDPGCRLAPGTNPTGVVPQDDPDGPLRKPGAVMLVYCGGPSGIEPGFSQTFDIPTLRTGNLDPGAYLAVVDYGDLRTGRVTAPFEVPADGDSGGTSSVGLPCSPEQQVGTDLDYSGPGRPTPAEAVAPFAEGSVLFTTQVGARQAEVRSQDADGVTVRVFRTNKLSDGWWPAGYLECASDAVAPSATDLDGTWDVRALVGRDAQSLLVGQNSDALSMTFDDGEMSGSSGCNSVFGTYVQSGPNNEDLTFPSNGLGSSAVGCTEPPLLERLQDVRHVSGEGDTRRLHAANWMIIVDLRRAE